MPKRTKEEAERTRRKILNAALDVFYEKGFVRTTLSDIAKKAGFTRGAIYWHFKDKVELFIALGEEISWNSLAEYENVPAQSLEEIHHFILEYLMLFVKNDKFRRFYELSNYKTEWSEELKPVLTRDRNVVRDIIESLTKDFDRLKEKNMLKKSINSRQAAISICAFVEGLIGIWIFDPEMISLEREAKKFLDILFESFKK